MSFDPNVPADDATLEHLLRDHRFGPPPPGDSNPWDFLQRWPQSVREQRVWPLVSKLLVDADAAVRARCLEFVDSWSDGVATTAARLAEVAERQPGLFGDQIVDDIALRDQYARTASTVATYEQGKRLAAVLRRMAADRPLAGSAAAVIAEYDPAFVIAQTRKWGAGASRWALAAARVFATQRRAELLDFLRAAAGLDEETRRQILARIDQVIDRAAGAPSAAERRAAIGLTS